MSVRYPGRNLKMIIFKAKFPNGILSR